jgi:hypothetical protein
MVGTPGAAVDAYAPSPANTRVRNPVIVPSFVPQSSTYSMWSRPWMVSEGLALASEFVPPHTPVDEVAAASVR